MWHRLLGQSQDAGGAEWQVGEGPAVRLVADNVNGLRAMVWEVQRLKTAQTFLRTQDIAYENVNGYVHINRNASCGLDIRLVEASA